LLITTGDGLINLLQETTKWIKKFTGTETFGTHLQNKVLLWRCLYGIWSVVWTWTEI